MNRGSESAKERKAVVGILGGMGPEATVRLFGLITAATQAKHDQEHLRVLVNSDPRIPDRTAAILGTGQDQLPALAEAASLLERAGADFLVMPCNTAHHWLPQLRARVQVPVVDMIEETALVVSRHVPPVRRLGLLATTGTCVAGLYQGRLVREGVAVVETTAQEQSEVMSVIYGTKSGAQGLGPLLARVAHALQNRGAEGFLLGCTELSLVGLSHSLGFPVFDPLEILARRAVALAQGWGASRSCCRT